MLTFLKILWTMFPFLKEIFFGKEPVQETILKSSTVHRPATLFVAANLLLFVLYVFSYNEVRSKETLLAVSLAKVENLQSALDFYKEHGNDKFGELKKNYDEAVAQKNQQIIDLEKRASSEHDGLIKAEGKLDAAYKTIDSLREQIRLMKGADGASTVKQRNAYLQRLEQLRKSEAGES